MYSLILQGRKLVKSQKWRNLRVSLNLLQNESAFFNSFSSASAPNLRSIDGRKEKNFTVYYLVDSLGFTTKLAETISRKVSFEDKVNPDSVLNLLRSHGFIDSQISTIIRAYPALLKLDAEKSLCPKLKFLQSRGASSSELTDIVSKVPKLLGIKKDKAFSRYYDFVKDIIEADKSCKFEKLCHSSAQGSRQGNIIRNVSALRELGVPQRLLFSLLISNSNICCGKERFGESLKKVVEMGFNPTTSKFLEALHVVYSLTDKTIEEKVQVYKRLGFAVGDVWEMFKKWPISLTFSEKNVLNSMETFLGLGFTRDEFLMMVTLFPQCIGLSSETVKKKTEFLVMNMNWPLKAMTSFPQVLGYSMQKRTVPRCNVIKALMSKGLFGNELPPLSLVLVCTDHDFLNKYVSKHDGNELVAELMAIYTGDLAV